IAILPLATFAAKVAPALASISSALGASAVPGSQTGTQWQVQAQVDMGALTGSPAHALGQATAIRNRIERSLPGQVVFVDNLADELTTATGDALYAETLYIMLAVPGALVALGLAYLAALGTVDRDRQSLALLRARGARRRDLIALAALESLPLGLLAGALGTGLALAAVRLAAAGSGIGTTRVLATFGVCVALAAAGAAAARIGTGSRTPGDDPRRVPARQRGQARRRTQSRPARARAAARLRCQSRHLRRHLRSAGAHRRATDPRRRRRRDHAARRNRPTRAHRE